MTVEHLRPFLERPADAELFCSLGQELAEASTPSSVVNVLRRRRITALQKPDGGVGGIVVGGVPSTGGSDDCTTVIFRSRGGNRTIPVCTLNSCRL